ncbi:signal peptidase I [bacterium]|nr:signal peptidase I [bacterium]
MFNKLKLRKMLKKLAIQGNRLEWIKKKRKVLPDPIERKLNENIQKIAEIFEERKKSQESGGVFAKDGETKLSLEYIGKILGETEYNLQHYFKKYRQSTAGELFDELWLVVLVALVLKFFVIGSFRVPTGSMVDTIEIGDNLFVSMFYYGLTMPFAGSQFVEFADPERGDIITFTEPGPEKKALVKRVIGVPGDSIFIHGKDVYVNGEKLGREKIGKVSYHSSRNRLEETTQYVETDENANKYNVIYNDSFTDEIREQINSRCPFCNRSFKVPERNYFVMGDNRDDSLDSRFWGFVPRGNVQGKPLFVWFSIQFGNSIFDVKEFRPTRIGHVFK